MCVLRKYHSSVNGKNRTRKKYNRSERLPTRNWAQQTNGKKNKMNNQNVPFALLTIVYLAVLLLLYEEIHFNGCTMWLIHFYFCTWCFILDGFICLFVCFFVIQFIRSIFARLCMHKKECAANYWIMHDTYYVRHSRQHLNDKLDQFEWCKRSSCNGIQYKIGVLTLAKCSKMHRWKGHTK